MVAQFVEGEGSASEALFNKLSAAKGMGAVSNELLGTILKCGITGAFCYPLSLNADGELFSDTAHTEASWTVNLESLLGVETAPTSVHEFFDIVHAADRTMLNARLLDVIVNGGAQDDYECRIVGPNNEIHWLMLRYSIGRDDLLQPVSIAGMCIDITSRKLAAEMQARAHQQLQQAQHFLSAALSSSGIGIFRHYFGAGAAEDSEEFANKSAAAWNFNMAELYGYPSGTPVSPALMTAHIHSEDREAVIETSTNALRAGSETCQVEYRIQTLDGSLRWMLIKMSLEKHPQGYVEFMSGAVIDITDRKLAQDQISYLGTHDGLTGLPNRVLFSSLLSQALETAKRSSQSFTLFFIDLDRFKAINDALGHQSGDLLLQVVAQRLRDSVRASDVVARLSGDEFVILLQNLGDRQQVSALARKVIAEVMKPITLRAQECRVTASIGICVFPDDAADEPTLMKHADSAMYQAKEEGKNNFQFYSENNSSNTLERMTLENQLRAALENDELSLHYQAKLDLQSNRITGVEALLRWNNALLGNVSPAQLIPIAEETGLIVPIGRWVLRTACLQNMAWQAQGLPSVCIAVNISPRQFLNENLLSDIAAALNELGMAPELLELEITEGMVMHNVEQAIALLHDIKRLGVRIAIDDFGTGYSSLAQLKRFPIDTLKVDRSFIREVADDTDDQAITEAIIAMGKSLSLTIVAEGVETLEQQSFLRNSACDEMQGYYFSRPVDAADFAALLNRHEA